jgi:hypothetical protein
MLYRVELFQVEVKGLADDFKECDERGAAWFLRMKRPGVCASLNSNRSSYPFDRSGQKQR